jgi:ATP-binding cassette subfamily B protein
VLTRLLGTFLRPYTWQAGLVVVLLMVQAIGNLYLPNLSGDVINNGVGKGDIGYIWRTGGVMLGIVFALGVLAVVTVYHASRVPTGVAADLRAAIYRRVQAFSNREMTRFIPSLITRNINDVNQIEMFLENALCQLVVAVLMSVGGMIMAIREGPTLSLLLLVAIPAMALIIGVTLVMTVLRHVTFGYPGSERPVLNDLTLGMKAKTKVTLPARPGRSDAVGPATASYRGSTGRGTPRRSPPA